VNTVRVEEVGHRFGSTVALSGASFGVAGGITGILGPNGAGKTTLLRCLATVLEPDEGVISMFGRDPRRTAQRTEIRRRIGYMPQESGFYRNFTCFEFVDYLAILKEHADTSTRHGEVRRVLDLAGLGDRSMIKIRKLSGGMRRRLLLAQALIGQPDLLILDEPTAGLDPEQRVRFREMISGLGSDRSVLLSTHQTEDVAAICDRVIVMDRGSISFDGAPGELVDVADGRVWMAESKPDAAWIAWRTGSGEFRAVGDPPAGARIIAPTIEDGYLLLVGTSGLETESGT
jgi:ABC-2 type transport system ATP-binding protein